MREVLVRASTRTLTSLAPPTPHEVIACVVERGVAWKILGHLGLPDEPPRMAPSRAPPVLEFGAWTHRGGRKTALASVTEWWRFVLGDPLDRI